MTSDHRHLKQRPCHPGRTCARCHMTYVAHTVFEAMPRSLQEEIGYPPCPEFVHGDTLNDQLLDLAEAWAPIRTSFWDGMACLLNAMTKGIRRLRTGRRP